MTEIYTKQGDSGMTSLFGGKRVAKDSAIIELFGAIDELNAFIGWIAEAVSSFHASERQSQPELSHLLKRFYRIQCELFAMGLHLNSEVNKEKVCQPTSSLRNQLKTSIHSQQTISNIKIDAAIKELENEIDAVSEKLPALNAFILPGGGEVGCRLHIARTVCRRTELAACKVMNSNKKAELVVQYLNRLSDWLYVMARYAAVLGNIEEIVV